MADAKVLLQPHGFVLLMPSEGVKVSQAELYRLLRAVEFSPWDGNGKPLFVVLEAHAPKSQWFEAGFWTGAGVPLFGVGIQFRNRHRAIIARLGGWLVQLHTPAELLGAVARRGLVPTSWDRDKHAEWILVQKEAH